MTTKELTTIIECLNGPTGPFKNDPIIGENVFFAWIGDPNDQGLTIATLIVVREDILYSVTLSAGPDMVWNILNATELDYKHSKLFNQEASDA